MSYILDALRRAEDDRRNAQSSAIEQITITRQSPTATTSHHPWRWAILAIVVIGLALVGLYIWSPGSHQQSAVAQSESTPALIPAVQLQSATTGNDRTTRAVLVPKPTGPNPIADADRLASLDDVMPPKPAPSTAPHVRANASNHAVRSYAASADTPPIVDDPAAVNSDDLQPQTISPAPLPMTPDQSISSSADSPDADASAAPPINTEALKTMPDSYRANFPAIDVQVHVYDDNAAKRWVLINGHRYREGDSLPQGPKIYKIVPEGTVFDWQGQRVLYPVKS